MISPEAFWMGRDTEYASELTEEIKANAEITLAKANELLERSNFKSRDRVSSGWRPRAINESTSNAAATSKHLTGQAIDIADADRSLATWCVDNLDVLGDVGLWMEDPRWTPDWVHLQIVPPRSGKRVFIPNSHPPLDPDFEVTWA